MKPPTTPREMIAHLQHELSVANNWIEHHQNHVDDLIKENAALRAAIGESEEFARKNGETAGAKIKELLRENAALRKDKERLDWIIGQAHYLFFKELGSDLAKGREQIDAARKEAQP